jgi:hypothetical protein
MDTIPIVVLAAGIAIACAAALWFAIALVVARGVGRVAAAGEHQHQMDVLHRDVRVSDGVEPGSTLDSIDSRPST